MKVGRDGHTDRHQGWRAWAHCRCNMTGRGGNQVEIPAGFNACIKSEQQETQP